jgi:type IV pilus assembly protein PilA
MNPSDPMQPQQQPMTAQPPAKKSNTALIVVVVAATVGLVVISLIGIMAALGIYGFRKYLSNAKEAEGRSGVAQIARGMVYCAETRVADGLPPLPKSTLAVPSSLAKVSGKKYMSTPAEWEEDAFKCASFSMSYPQYFQYQWLLEPGGMSGRARAVADLDGDGTGEIAFEVSVTCDSSKECSAATSIDEQRP